MALVDRFKTHVLALVGRYGLRDPDLFLQEAFAQVTMTPSEALKRLEGTDTRRTGDVALRRGHSAVYVGSGTWVESGLRVHVTNEASLIDKGATFYRTHITLEVPQLEGDYFYWALIHGTGQDINRLKAWAQMYGMEVTVKRTSRKWQKFGHEAAKELPE